MRGQVLDDAGLRRAQLEQLVAVLLLGELLVALARAAARLDALGLQLPAVVGGDLRDAFCSDCAIGAWRAADGRLLGAQVLLLLDALALLVGVQEPAGEAVLGELLEGLLLLDVVRQRCSSLALRRLRRREVVARLSQQRPLLRQRVLVGARVRRVLRLDLREELGGIVGARATAACRRAGVDAPQREALGVVLGRTSRVGVRERRCPCAPAPGPRAPPRPPSPGSPSRCPARPAARSSGSSAGTSLPSAHGDDVEPAEQPPTAAGTRAARSAACSTTPASGDGGFSWMRSSGGAKSARVGARGAQVGCTRSSYRRDLRRPFSGGQAEYLVDRQPAAAAGAR